MDSPRRKKTTGSSLLDVYSWKNPSSSKMKIFSAVDGQEEEGYENFMKSYVGINMKITIKPNTKQNIPKKLTLLGLENSSIQHKKRITVGGVTLTLNYYKKPTLTY
ncbi:hypothetical protein LXL04_009498 [Taraxacum kok-saghyz]